MKQNWKEPRKSGTSHLKSVLHSNKNILDPNVVVFLSILHFLLDFVSTIGGQLSEMTECSLYEWDPQSPKVVALKNWQWDKNTSKDLQMFALTMSQKSKQMKLSKIDISCNIKKASAKARSTNGGFHACKMATRGCSTSCSSSFTCWL